MHTLLAVVEVNKDSRVVCQAAGCGRHVYRRIHVVRDGEKISVLGQTCYSKMYLGATDAGGGSSVYTGNDSRELTHEEIALLVGNTQNLISQFEQEHASKLKLEQDQKKRVEAETSFTSPDPNVEEASDLKEVKCHYCHAMMKTRLKSAPAIGYKCDLCFKFHRPMPSKRMGITAAQNAQANIIDMRKAATEDEYYKNIRG